MELNNSTYSKIIKKKNNISIQNVKGASTSLVI